MFTPPSLIDEYVLVSSMDPALEPRPAEPGEREPADVRQAHEERVKAWLHKLERARETGRWEGLIRAGQQPTTFRMRPVPGTLRRRLSDLQRGEYADRPSEYLAICFRAAIVGVDHLGPERVKVEQAHDPVVGEPIATRAIVDQLDAIHPAIVSELGLLVHDRSMRAPPKS